MEGPIITHKNHELMLTGRYMSKGSTDCQVYEFELTGPDDIYIPEYNEYPSVWRLDVYPDGFKDFAGQDPTGLYIGMRDEPCITSENLGDAEGNFDVDELIKQCRAIHDQIPDKQAWADEWAEDNED